MRASRRPAASEMAPQPPTYAAEQDARFVQRRQHSIHTYGFLSMQSDKNFGERRGACTPRIAAAPARGHKPDHMLLWICFRLDKSSTCLATVKQAKSHWHLKTRAFRQSRRHAMNRILAEDDRFRVYSLHEDAFLKDKSTSAKLNEHTTDDVQIAHQYGDPEGALISRDGSYVVVVGHGISIFPLKEDCGIKPVELYNSPGNEMWTIGVHQSCEDGSWLFFRFVSYYDNDKLRVYRMNAQSLTLEMLD
jgi:hypothetical protein